MDFRQVKKQAILRQQEQDKAKMTMPEHHEEIDIKGEQVLDQNGQLVLILTEHKQIAIYEMRHLVSRTSKEQKWIYDHENVSNAKLVDQNVMLLVDEEANIMMTQIDYHVRKVNILQGFPFSTSSTKMNNNSFDIVLNNGLVCIQNNESGIVNIYELDQNKVLVQKCRIKMPNAQQIQFKDNNLYFLQNGSCLTRYDLENRCITAIKREVEQFRIIDNRIVILQEGELKEVDQDGRMQQSMKLEKWLAIDEYDRIEIDDDNDNKYVVDVCNDRIYLMKQNGQVMVRVKVDDWTVHQYKVNGFNADNMMVVEQLDQFYVLYVKQNRVKIKQIYRQCQKVEMRKQQIQYQQQEQLIDIEQNDKQYNVKNEMVQQSRQKDVLSQIDLLYGYDDNNGNNTNSNNTNSNNTISNNTISNRTNSNNRTKQENEKVRKNNEEDAIIQTLTDRIVEKVQRLVERQGSLIEQKLDSRMEMMEDRVDQIMKKVQNSHDRYQMMEEQKEQCQKQYFQDMIEFNQGINHNFQQNMNNIIQQKQSQESNQLQFHDVYQKIKQNVRTQQQFQTKLDQLIVDMQKQQEQITQCIFSMQIGLFSQNNQNLDLDYSQQLARETIQQRNMNDLQNNFEKQKMKKEQENLIDILEQDVNDNKCQMETIQDDNQGNQMQDYFKTYNQSKLLNLLRKRDDDKSN